MRIINRIWVAAMLLPGALLAGDVSFGRLNPAPVSSASKTTATETGIASFYADRYHGRPTASGEIFDLEKLTAAHRTLPFGTVVKVTHQASQRSVAVRINDRGPFVAGRVTDL